MAVVINMHKPYFIFKTCVMSCYEGVMSVLCTPLQVLPRLFSNVTLKGKKVQHFVMPIFPPMQRTVKKPSLLSLNA